MCGACGRRSQSHWSAPFLASQAARATAARAVDAMVRPAANIAATPAGYLVRRPSGAATVGSDLGSVWQLLDTMVPGHPRSNARPMDVLGPITIPPPRPWVADVELLVDQGDGVSQMQGRPLMSVLDGRRIPTSSIPMRLDRHVHTADARPRALLVREAQLEQLAPQLEADLTRRYQVYGTCEPGEDPLHRSPDQRVAAEIPALLAWAAGLRRFAGLGPMAVRIPLGQGRDFVLDALHGVVLRCAAVPGPG